MPPPKSGYPHPPGRGAGGEVGLREDLRFPILAHGSGFRQRTMGAAGFRIICSFPGVACDQISGAIEWPLVNVEQLNGGAADFERESREILRGSAAPVAAR